jgi:hypothetical protein
MTPRLAPILALALAACASGGAPERPDAPAPTPSSQSVDTTGQDLIPAGYGTMRQDDLAMRFQTQSALVRVIPLEESVIRVLSPDSYRALRELLESKRVQVQRWAPRTGGRPPVVFYVSFYGLEPESRFSPMEFVVNSKGRDFRPLEIIPLSPGFGEQRLRQREVQSALYVFEDGLDVSQPLSVTVEGVSYAGWANTLREIERERALVRTRAGRG